MRLLEIVRGRATIGGDAGDGARLCQGAGQGRRRRQNGPGFVGNRMMFPYMYETQYMVEEGATPEQVDKALTGFGMAMGIFAVDDMAGIDVAIRAQRALNHFSSPSERRPLVQAALVDAGRLGQKTGKGWYCYGDDRKPKPDPDGGRLDSGEGARRPASRSARSRTRRLSSARFTPSSTRARA